MNYFCGQVMICMDRESNKGKMGLRNEQLIIAEFKRGSKEAFEQIYQMYAKRLLAYCFQYTKCYEDAEEIVEDVFVSLWNNRGKIRQEETLSSLLYTMSKHYVINAYRATVNSPVYEDYVAYQNELSTSEDHYKLDYELYMKTIKNAIKQLPLTQQRVISLSRFSLLSNQEIAERLSLSEQTVKNQLSLGLKTLRMLLEKMSLLYLVGTVLHIANKWF